MVDPKYQKQGIGKMLIDVTVQKAKELGFRNLYLFAFDPAMESQSKKPEETLFSQNRFLLFTVGAIAISIPVIAAAASCFNSSDK